MLKAVATFQQYSTSIFDRILDSNWLIVAFGVYFTIMTGWLYYPLLISYMLRHLIHKWTLTRHWCAQGHKHHSCNSVLQAYCTTKVRGQISSDSGQNPDECDGDDEAGPAVPVLSGWNEGKKNLPENCQEVHDVIKARGQALLPALLLIIITWGGKQKVHYIVRFAWLWLK